MPMNNREQFEIIYTKTVKSFGLEENNILLSDWEWLDREGAFEVLLPKRGKPTKMLAVFIKYYARERSVDSLTLSDQEAAPSRDLRNRGVKFDSYGSKDFCERRNGKTFRKIKRWGYKKVISQANTSYIGKGVNLTKFLKGKSCCLCGSSTNLELDHLEPQSRLCSIGKTSRVEWPCLTDESIFDGTWMAYFQVLCKSCNCRKREACIKCQNGEQPPVPDSQKEPGYLHLKLVDELQGACFRSGPSGGPCYLSKGHYRWTT